MHPPSTIEQNDLPQTAPFTLVSVFKVLRTKASAKLPFTFFHFKNLEKVGGGTDLFRGASSSLRDSCRGPGPPLWARVACWGRGRAGRGSWTGRCGVPLVGERERERDGKRGVS